MASVYYLPVTEEELKALVLITSYFRLPNPLDKVARDVEQEVGEPTNPGNLVFKAYQIDENNQEAFIADYEEVMIDWPENWEAAWDDEPTKTIRRNF